MSHEHEFLLLATFLPLGQEEWLRRFDGDEVVPVSFQFYDRKSTTPAGPFITQRPDDPRPNGVLTGRASLKRREKVRSREFLTVSKYFTENEP
jgi:hypothetical protein